MKHNLNPAALLLCVVFLILACKPKEDESTSNPVIDKEQIKKEIQAKETEFANYYNLREFKNLGYYADDAISFSQNKAPIIGREAIVEYLKSGIETSNKRIKISFTTNEVFVSNDGNQVVEIGYYKLTDSIEVSINSGNYMVLFEKRNGTYVSVREMSASDMPLE